MLAVTTYFEPKFMIQHLMTFSYVKQTEREPRRPCRRNTADLEHEQSGAFVAGRQANFGEGTGEGRMVDALGLEPRTR